LRKLIGCCDAAFLTVTTCTLPYIGRAPGRKVLCNTCGAVLLFFEEILAKKGFFCAAGIAFCGSELKRRESCELKRLFQSGKHCLPAARLRKAGEAACPLYKFLAFPLYAFDPKQSLK
jgi:hypothetical protein